MKKLFFLCAFATVAIGMQAQTSFDQVYQKYAGKDGITTVEVSQKLFELCASALSEEDADVKELVSGLKGIKIICYENTEGAANGKSMYKEFEAALPSGFDELMQVNSDGEKVRFLGKVVDGSIVDEMILLVDSEDEFVMIDIIGRLDFQKIGKLSDMNLDIDGLDELEKVDDK
ncbi:MAG: DUF4252 domain-containing protein [Fimbriimonadaceae bacterium]|nr:DUF4252 domain-containing protein [Chitinophagales bacterium]